MSKPKKTARIDMRVVPELDERAKALAESLGISRNELIERAIWNYVLDRKKFACCPACEDPIFEIERMPIAEGISEVECSKGHKHYFDFETEKWVR